MGLLGAKNRIFLCIGERWPTEGGTLPWFRAEGGAIRNDPLRDIPSAGAYTIIAPAAVIFFTSVMAPERNRKLMEKSARYAIEDQLITDPDENHVMVGPVSEQGKMGIGVISKKWLDDVIRALRVESVVPDTLIAETLVPPIDKSNWSMVYGAGSGFVRTGEFDGFWAGDSGDVGKIPIQLELAIQSAQAIGGTPATIDLWQWDNDEDIDTKVWEKTTGLIVNRMGRWNVADMACDRQAVRFNFLKGEYEPEWKKAKLGRNLTVTGLLTAAVLTLLLAFIGGDWYRLKSETANQKAVINSVLQESFPDIKVIIDARLQMERRLAALRGRRGSENDFLPLISKAAPQFPQGSRFHEIIFEGGVLKVNVTTPSDKPSTVVIPGFSKAGLSFAVHSEEKTDQGNRMTISIKKP